jgi:hypothetical protein
MELVHEVDREHTEQREPAQDVDGVDADRDRRRGTVDAGRTPVMGIHGARLLRFEPIPDPAGEMRRTGSGER